MGAMCLTGHDRETMVMDDPDRSFRRWRGAVWRSIGDGYRRML